MVYCQNCGHKCDSGSFCPECGKPLNNYSQNSNPGFNVQISIARQEKSVGLAALLSFLFPGAGTIYAGKIGKGIAICLLLMFISSACFTLYFIALPEIYLSADHPVAYGFEDFFSSDMMLSFYLMMAVPLVLYIASIFSAAKDAKKYNKLLNETGKAPW